jgi:hypothetical protein
MAGLPTDRDSCDPFSRYISPEQMHWKATGRHVSGSNFFGRMVTRVEEVRTRFSPTQSWHEETRLRRERSRELSRLQVTTSVEPASTSIFDTSAAA